MSKRIVIINQSTGYLFIDIANAFRQDGYEVVLMAGNILPMNEPLDAGIKVQKIFSYNRGNTVKRILSWLISLLNIGWLVLLKYRGYDLLVSSNPPTSSSMLPLLFRRNITLVIYDIYPDGLVAGGFVTKNHFIFKSWAWLNKKAYQKVNAIITLTPGMASAMQAYAPVAKIMIVPAWAGSVNNGVVIKDSENEFLSQFNLQGKFIVMYAGNLGKEYELEALVQLAEACKENDEMRFVIMGKGWKKGLLAALIEDKKLHNCLLLPYQPATLFMHSLNAFHVGVVSLASAVAKVAIPSKTYNLLAAHRPIFCIGNEESDLAHFLTGNEVGIAVEANKIDEMKSFIEKLYTDKQFYHKMCDNAATVALDYTKERAKEIVAIVKSQ